MRAARRDFGDPAMSVGRGRPRPAGRTVGHVARSGPTEFSRRDDPEVAIVPDEHLMCVNFHRVDEAEYRYAGGRPVRGVRHVGSSHLVPAGNEIRGHTPGPTDHVVFHFRPDWFRELAGTTFGSEHVSWRTDGLPFFDPTLFQLATLLRDELVADTPGGPLAIESVTTLVGVHLLRTRSSLGGDPREYTRLGTATLARVTAFIEEHLADRLTVADLAAVAGLSEYHFLRTFRRATGRTPRQYVIDRRVDHVRRHLDDADLAQLSVEAGFAHQSHMTRAFRERIGMTPDAFRRRSGSRRPAPPDRGQPGSPG